MPCKIIEPRICPTQNIKENVTYSSSTPVLLFDHHFNIFSPIALWPLLLNVIVFSMNNGFSSSSMLWRHIVHILSGYPWPLVTVCKVF